MRLIIPFIAILLLVFTACDRGTTTRRADPELAAKIQLLASSKGRTFIEERGVSVEDFEVTLKNGTTKTIYITCSQPKFHSAYIRERNPLAICYETNGQAGSMHLSSRGLLGRGSSIPIRAGENIVFIAPMPILPDDPATGSFKIKITAYLDEGLHQGRYIYSEVLEHKKNNNGG